MSYPYEERQADAFIDDLLTEWEIKAARFHFADIKIDTIFIGGGTPSILSSKQWNRLDRRLFRPLNAANAAEWTIECNPDSFTSAKASQWLDSGVTRLSLGVQSLHDRELRLLGRPHDSGLARKTLREPVLKQFRSINADIMYGLPGQTVSSLRKTVRELLDSAGVRHLSAYELTLAESTPLHRHRALLHFPGEETLRDMQAIIRAETAKCGIAQYEISNYATPGHECRHNIAYWTHRPYIGLGPSAHSFFNAHRFANIADPALYHERLAAGKAPIAFTEPVQSRALVHELIFLRLRMNRGLDESEFQSLTQTPFYSAHRRPALDLLLKRGMIERAEQFWRLTDKGRDAADGVARMLFDQTEVC